MAPDIKGQRTAIYKVSNLNKAKEWYTAVLGVPPYFDEPFYVGYNAAGYELGLQPDDAAAATKTANVMVYWGVPDVAAAHKQLIAMGASPLEEPADVGGGIVVGAVKDPWGNAFGLIYNPHFKL